MLKVMTIVGLYCLDLVASGFHQWHFVSLFADVISCESEMHPVQKYCSFKTNTIPPCFFFVSEAQGKFLNRNIG